MSPNSQRIIVKRGLEGQDENIDLLQKYFREMQKSTVEASIPTDFLSFATCAHYFGVILAQDGGGLDDCGDEDAEGEPEEDSEAVAVPIYPESSTATSPPPSTVLSSPSVVEQESDGWGNHQTDPLTAFYSLSSQEKIERWQKAFFADINSQPIVPPLHPIGLLDQAGGIFAHDKGKGKAFVGIPSWISQVHNTPDTDIPSTSLLHDDDPESFINWPEDSMAVDDTPTIYDVYETPRGKLDPNVGGDGSQPYEQIPQQTCPENGNDKQDSQQTQIPELPKIETEPEVKAMIFDAAIKFRNELRARRVADHEKKMATPVLQPPPPHFVKAGTLNPFTFKALGSKPKENELRPIGLIYLLASQNFDDPLHMGECSLGFYIAPEYRNNEHLVDALDVAIEQAFSDRQCHRLEAIVVDNADKLYTFELLTACGFHREGTRRHGFFSPIAQEWKDVFYYGMLVTDWVHDSDKSTSVRLRTSSLWDEVITRHQRERDDLHRLEERSQVRRSNSVETVRQKGNELVDPDFNNTMAFVRSNPLWTPSLPVAPSITPVAPSMAPRKKVVLGSVAQARHKQGSSSSSSQGSSNFNPTPYHGQVSAEPEPFSPEPPSSPVRSRYETNIPSSSTSPQRSRGRRSTGGFSISSSSTASSDLSSQWDLLDDI